MKIAIVGLGLIGGSLGRTIVKNTQHTVYAFDISHRAMLDGKLLKAYHHELDDKNIGDIDLIFFSLYPDALEKALCEYCPRLKDGALVVDCCGNKRRVVGEMQQLAKTYPRLNFISSHPMAGREFSGVSHSTATLFDKASMILVPVKADIKTIQGLKEFSLAIGFGTVVITNAKEHDRIIAYTSQLAHLVSSSYIKSPTAVQFMGFSAGSFRDMTRVARLSPEMWSELTTDNADFLVGEIQTLIDNLTEYKNALENGDKDKMKELLSDGNDKKLQSEKMRRSKIYEN
ncbi:MAG: prephenate dehydrogenase [Clostridiales bacterium]|nr:prephenate dehydrogenase [Clostridiales bacterium]